MQIMIIIVPGQHGTAAPRGVKYFNPGDDLTITATPDSGYAVDKWLLNNVLTQTGGNTLTITDIQEGYVVELSFVALPAPPAPTLNCFFETLSWNVPEGVSSTNVYISPDATTFTLWFNSTSDTQSEVPGKQFYRVTSVGDGVAYAGESDPSNIVRSV